MDTHQADKAKVEPALKLKFLSHGTLESRDLEKARRFYEEFLGLDCIRTSPISLMIKLGGQHTYAVVQNPKKASMPLLAHNGLDVASRQEVDRAWEICNRDKDKFEIKQITKPADQHGTYSFYVLDLDDNYWEILTNPEGGYAWMFSQGTDLKSWGAGQGDEVNPNEFKGRGKSAPGG